MDADGVHLGQDDLPLSAARKLAPELLIGVSTHSLEEALVAERDGADYVNIGPIFPTKTKKGVEYFLGPDAILALSACAVQTPAITQAPDIAEAVKSLKNKLRGQFL